MILEIIPRGLLHSVTYKSNPLGNIDVSALVTCFTAITVDRKTLGSVAYFEWFSKLLITVIKNIARKSLKID